MHSADWHIIFIEADTYSQVWGLCYRMFVVGWTLAGYTFSYISSVITAI